MPIFKPKKTDEPRHNYLNDVSESDYDGPAELQRSNEAAARQRQVEQNAIDSANARLNRFEHPLEYRLRMIEERLTLLEEGTTDGTYS